MNKTTIDAVNEYEAEWPLHANNHMVFSTVSGEIRVWRGTAIHEDLNKPTWKLLCTFEEFNQCVDEMSKAEWIKPVILPTYTQAMADNGVLPSVGMEVLYTCIEHQSGKPVIEVGKWYSGNIIAYHDGFVWTSDNGLRQLSNTKFKPLTPPIELIDGECYQFDYQVKTNLKGIYNKRSGRFTLSESNIYTVYCTNIQPLTVEIK